MALARGMQAFEISAAKHLNASVSQRTGNARRGNVFGDRYHVEVLRTRRRTRNALSYVLNNWRRHGEHQYKFAADWQVDPFSSAPSFHGFKDIDARSITWPERYVPLPVWAPRTWLFQRAGRSMGSSATTRCRARGPSRRHDPESIRRRLAAQACFHRSVR